MMAKEKLNTYWGEVSTLHLPKIATIERNFITSSFHSIKANRFVTKNRYRSLISSSLDLFIANRLALATSFLLLLITSFLVSSSLHSQIPSYVPTNGLVGYWPFNGNANDESGNGNHGTVNGATLTADRNGNANSAYSFDGNDRISASDSNFPLGSSSRSIFFWMNNLQSSSAYALPFSYGSNSSYSGVWFNHMQNDPSGRPQGSVLVDFYDVGMLTNTIVPFNQWVQIGITYNGDTHQVSFYLNGECNDSSYINFNTISNYFSIGASSANFYDALYGYIDDFIIYNRALTQEEITALYNGTTNTYIAGCTNNTACNYNATATQDDGSCTYPAQTYLNCAGTCINDADNDGTCDELETPTLPSYLPSNGLEGYWPFNGNANDESGNGNHGTVNGATLTSDRNGNANSAYAFDGVSNQIDANNISNFNISPNSTNTISFWFYANGDSFGRLLSYTSHIPGDMSYRIQFVLEANGNIIFNGAQYTGLADPPYVQLSCSNIILNTWNNIIVTHENSLVKIFANGELINTNLYTGPNTTSAQMMNLHLGYIPNEPEHRFSGKLDDIAIYNRALTQEEITALYNGTTAGGGGGNGGTAGTPAPSVPQGIPYQAMIRDNNGAALVNTPVTVRFSLRQDAIDGTVEYQETHNLTTNTFGLVNTHFGSGTATQGTFANINWSNTTKFIQVEANSGSGFVEMGTQQMMSVPFALKANESNKVKNAGLPVYANNAAALAGGLVAGDMYRTAAGILMIVY